MKSFKLLILVLHSSFLIFNLIGCGPTYPKGRVDASIVDLCKKEYGVDVEVKIANKTIGIYIPINDLLDKNLALNPQAVSKVDDVIMSVSRVALSTDADFNFYVLIAQDPAIPELQLVIIRYVEDIKRFLVTDISRNEYFDRMITELKLTPQAQKERLIRQLFEKLGLQASEDIIEAYFKSGYIETISDIGYWNKKFFLKDITIEEFITRQVEERIRKDFTRQDDLKPFKLNFVKGSYGKGVFDFELDIGLKSGYVTGSITSQRTPVLKHIYQILSGVLRGYRYQDYSHINIYYDTESIVFTKEDLNNIRRGKMSLEDII